MEGLGPEASSLPLESHHRSMGRCDQLERGRERRLPLWKVLSGSPDPRRLPGDLHSVLLVEHVGPLPSSISPLTKRSEARDWGSGRSRQASRVSPSVVAGTPQDKAEERSRKGC